MGATKYFYKIQYSNSENIHSNNILQSWTKLFIHSLCIYLAKYDPHFQQGVTAPLPPIQCCIE